MIVIRVVENGFIVDDGISYDGSKSEYASTKEWVAPTIDELKDVVAALAETERKHKQEQKTL